MDQVKVSSKFRIVIPRRIRKSLRICAGQKIQVVEYEGCFHFVPIRPMKELRGTLSGIDTTIARERDRV